MTEAVFIVTKQSEKWYLILNKFFLFWEKYNTYNTLNDGEN